MKAIETRYHGPRAVRGSRMSATDNDGNRVTIGYDHGLNSDGNHAAAALALCAKMGWHGVLARGDTKHGHVFVWSVDGQGIIAPKLPQPVRS